MNQTGAQLNSIKTPFLKNMIRYNVYGLLCFSITFLLSLPAANAQSNNCPTGEPLEWEWLQEIINFNYGCDVAEIRVLDFDGDYIIETIGGEPENIPCISSTKNRAYDCLGLTIGEFEGDITSIIDPVLFPESYEYYSIWTYVEKTNQQIIPVEACPGEVLEFEIGLPTDGGDACEPAGERIGINPEPNSFKPSIKNLTNNNCTLSFSFNSNGDFIYSVYNPTDTIETFNYVFLLSTKENCKEPPAPQPVISKDWTPFPANQKTWFEFSNENFKLPALYYATNASQQDDQIAYYLDGNNTMGIVGNYANEYCTEGYNSQTQDFISVTEPFTDQNGVHYFQDQLVFDANLKVGESIVIQSNNYIDIDEVYIKCEEQRNEAVFGQNDEVKVFSLQAYANGQPVESAFDNFNYILSKSFGFLQFLPFIELLNEPKTTASLTGIENEQGNLVGTKGDQFKPPYEAGDVIYYSEKSGPWLNFFDAYRNWRDSIIRVEHYKDSLIYTFDRIEIIKELVLDINHPIIDTLVTIDTIQTYNSQETFIYEEQLDNKEDIRFYNSEFYGIYHSIYGYYLGSSSNSGTYLYGGLNIQPNCFSFNNERATIVKSSKPIFFIYDDGCRSGGSLEGGSTYYHSELGKIFTYYADDCCLDLRWSLDVYKKGNQLYSPFVQLNPVYDISDSAIDLMNECHNGQGMEVAGPAIENNIFYPVFVPDSLLNQPIEINFKTGLYETKQTVTVNNSAGAAFEIDPFFDNKKWLSNHVNLRKCEGETIEVFERNSFTYYYLTRNSGEGILFSSYNNNQPKISCEDTKEESTCLTENNLTNPVLTWACSNFVSALGCTDSANCNYASSTFNIYPNPTSHKVFIETPKNASYQISLTDISGKLIKQVETQRRDRVIEIDVSNLLKGIYLVELKSELNSIIQKLVIQ